MSKLQTQRQPRTSGSKSTTDRVFVLDASNTGRMFTMNTDGSEVKNYPDRNAGA